MNPDGSWGQYVHPVDPCNTVASGPSRASAPPRAGESGAGPRGELGVDPRRAVDAAPGGEHAADVAAQLGLRLGPGAAGIARSQA